MVLVIAMIAHYQCSCREYYQCRCGTHLKRRDAVANILAHVSKFPHVPRGEGEAGAFRLHSIAIAHLRGGHSMIHHGQLKSQHFSPLTHHPRHSTHFFSPQNQHIILPKDQTTRRPDD